MASFERLHNEKGELSISGGSKIEYKLLFDDSKQGTCEEAFSKRV